jgi:cell wall-associated NlpC family hydrolase
VPNVVTDMSLNRLRALSPLATALSAAGVAALMATLLSVGAAAAATAHSPIGHLDSAAGTSARTIVVRGWAYDPDYPRSAIPVDIYIDGHGRRVYTGLYRPDVARAFPGVGSFTGFRLVSGTLGYGSHRVCTYLINRGLGGTTGLGCRTVTFIDPHNPKGSLSASLAGRTVTVRGMAYDPDTTASIHVSFRVDAGNWYSAPAALSTPLAPIPGAHGYSRSWTLPYGTHTVCVTALNVLAGTGNTSLGCRSIAIPAPVTLNQQIAAYAKTFVGRYPYAYGGQSPATGFDCSGLTYYVYRHYGRTIATTAQGQYNQFRRVALGAALPGDLVFFHDSRGSVFHVGVYEGANMMVAAATPQDGIRYQSIWSSNVTYGTTTH